MKYATYYFNVGDSYQSLSFLFRIPPTIISRIVPEVCQALFEDLKQDYLKVCNFLKGCSFHKKLTNQNCHTLFDVALMIN